MYCGISRVVRLILHTLSFSRRGGMRSSINGRFAFGQHRYFFYNRHRKLGRACREDDFGPWVSWLEAAVLGACLFMQTGLGISFESRAGWERKAFTLVWEAILKYPNQESICLMFICKVSQEIILKGQFRIYSNRVTQRNLRRRDVLRRWEVTQ